MQKISNRKFIFSGGPGAGKTTVLDELRRRGYHCVAETARAVIRARRLAGLPPRPAPAAFAQQILQADITHYRQAPAHQPSLFDRSIVDALFMLQQCNAMNRQQINALLQRYPYHHVVLLFPPWQQIYRQDAERDQTFAQAKATYVALENWYRECGYVCLQVAPDTVQVRARFIERVINTPPPIS